jgi:hypothetical protein
MKSFIAVNLLIAGAVASEPVADSGKLCSIDLCEQCDAVKGNTQAITDAQCQQDCIKDGTTTWPCNNLKLCQCTKVGTTTTRGPATTGGPSGDKDLDAAWAKMYAKLKDVDYSNTLFQSILPTNEQQSCIGANKSKCRASRVYVGQDFLQAAEKIVKFGIGGKKFYIGEYKNADWTEDIGLLNLALFLGQAMEETILYDVCDENSWDRVNHITGEAFNFQTPQADAKAFFYPATNACGQLKQDYSSYECPADEKHYECPLDPEMALHATTHAEWWGAPPPLQCGPNVKATSHSADNKGYDQDGFCGEGSDKPCPNTAGKDNLTNCCWWGRGIIQTTGRCNIGKLNHFLGAGGDGTMYPTANLCKQPNLICEGPSDLKWMAGFFYWIDKVQTKIPAQGDVPAFDFQEEIAAAVKAKDSKSMATKCSGMVNRGCPAAKCKTGAVHKLGDRQASTLLAVHQFLGNDWTGRLLEDVTMLI